LLFVTDFVPAFPQYFKVGAGLMH